MLLKMIVLACLECLFVGSVIELVSLPSIPFAVGNSS